MTAVFEGISVLDFSWGQLGSVATMVMSDFGAQVIKVEPPGGDPARALPASLQWNRGKKSVILDLKTPDGRRQAQDLASRSDVVLVNFRPGVAERLGIGYEELKALRPDLIYVSITGFGPRGPYANYKGYEQVVAAKIGRMATWRAQADRNGPRYGAVNVASHAVAMAAVTGTAAALILRDRTGQGQKIETSLLQGFQHYDLTNWAQWQCMIKFPDDFPQLDPTNAPRNPPTPGYLPMRCKDGRWLQNGSLVRRPVRQFIEVVGLGHILNEPRFANAPTMLPQEAEDLRGMILEKAKEKTADEWMELYIQGEPSIAGEPYRTSEQAMDHPQIVHNGHVEEVQDPRVGKMRQIGVLSKVADAPGRIAGPAPEPGQHTQEVLNSLNGPRVGARSYGNQSMPQYPLAGINVLDFSSVIAGPTACSLLYEMGARVIHIEVQAGDVLRTGLSIYTTMAGHENVSLDLTKPEGLEIALKLAARADIVVNNMRPGAAERLGIGYEQLKAIKPDIVYVYAVGYGSTGPHSHRPAMHPTMGAATGGVLAQIGRGGLPPADQEMTIEETKEAARRLYVANDANPDFSATHAICASAAMGLYMRHKTGKAQHVESTMLGGNVYANIDDFFSYEGRPPRQIADADGWGLNALYRLYEAKTGYVFLACPFEEEWQTLCRTIGKPELLEDPRFSTPAARASNDAALIEELTAVFVGKEPLEWEKLLTDADVACVQVEDRGLFFFFDDNEHVRENGFTTNVEFPRRGTLWRYGPMNNFSQTATRVGSAPLVGQQSRPVLRELGYSEEQILELREKGVVIWTEE